MHSRKKTQTAASGAFRILCQTQACHPQLLLGGAVRAAYKIAFGFDGDDYIASDDYFPPSDDDFVIFKRDSNEVPLAPSFMSPRAGRPERGVEETKHETTQQEETKAAHDVQSSIGQRPGLAGPAPAEDGTYEFNWVKPSQTDFVREQLGLALVELCRLSGNAMLSGDKARRQLHAILRFLSNGEASQVSTLIAASSILVFRMAPHIEASTQPAALVLKHLLEWAIRLKDTRIDVAVTVLERSCEAIHALAKDVESKEILRRHVWEVLTKVLACVDRAPHAHRDACFMAVAEGIGALSSGDQDLVDARRIIPAEHPANERLSNIYRDTHEMQAREDRRNHNIIYCKLRQYRDKFHRNDIARHSKELEQFKASGLDHYDFGNVLGAGASGYTYKARIKVQAESPFAPRLMGTEVAIKRLKDFGQAQHEQARAIRDQQLREFQFAQEIAHPFILRSLCSFWGKVVQPDAVESEFGANNTLYIVMDLAAESLEERVHRKPLTEREALFILLQLAYALDRMHRKGYAHRDVKADNIVLTKLGDALLIDFDCARPFKVPHADKGGHIGGQPPEVIRAVRCSVRRAHAVTYGMSDAG